MKLSRRPYTPPKSPTASGNKARTASTGEGSLSLESQNLATQDSLADPAEPTDKNASGIVTGIPGMAPPKSTKNTPTLPVEILGEVYGHVSDKAGVLASLGATSQLRAVARIYSPAAIELQVDALLLACARGEKSIDAVLGDEEADALLKKVKNLDTGIFAAGAGPAGRHILAKILPRMTQLRGLTLDGYTWDTESKMADAIKECPQLLSLKITNLGLKSDRYFRPFCGDIGFEKLEVLHLPNLLNPPTVNDLSQAIARMTNLKVLDLHAETPTKVYEVPVNPSLWRALDACPLLQELNVGFQSFNAETAALLASKFANMTNLKKLCLDGLGGHSTFRGMSNSAFAPVLNGLRELTSLRHFSCRNTPFNPLAPFPDVLAAISGNRGLKSLMLTLSHYDTSNRDDKGAQKAIIDAILRSATSFPELSTMHLHGLNDRNNPNRRTFWPAVGAALAAYKHLTHLELLDMHIEELNQPKDRGVLMRLFLKPPPPQPFAWLEELKDLTTLVISHANIDGYFVDRLFTALSGAKQVRSLRLGTQNERKSPLSLQNNLDTYAQKYPIPPWAGREISSEPSSGFGVTYINPNDLSDHSCFHQIDDHAEEEWASMIL